MKEKDFKSLSVNEQKEKINELITSWYEQDSNNRCAIVILGDRENKEDAGKSSCCVLGLGTLIAASLKTALDNSEGLKQITAYCLIGSLRKLSSIDDEFKEEE